jgi:hypothetical protein
VYSLYFMGVEALEVDQIGLCGVSILLQHFKYRPADILAFLSMEPRGLDLWIDSDPVPGTVVQPLDQLNFLREGMTLVTLSR